MAAKPLFDTDRAIERLISYLAIEGITGHEKAIGKAVAADLIAHGVPRRCICFDQANQRIPLATETGNLIVTFEGTLPGPRLLFSTHLDTVPLCAGATPIRKGNRIVAAGATALGGDDRTGVACLVTLAATLMTQQLPHPPLTLLFTVREESGLWGARMVEREALGRPAMGFNVDGRSAQQLTIGAVGAERWEAEIFGRAAHAGVHPEQGISATVIAALALADVHKNGWIGKVDRKDGQGTSNVGVLSGSTGSKVGAATNVVTDYMRIEGESRSHERRFTSAITNAYRQSFRQAARQVRNDHGRCGRVRFATRRTYEAFRLDPDSPVVCRAQDAATLVGLTPAVRISNGGLDANWLVRHGIPTVSFGAGQNGIHAIGEFVDIREFLNGCRLALALATHK